MISGLQIYAGVTRAAAAEMVHNYFDELNALLGIDIKPKATADPKPADAQDPFAIPSKR